MITAHRYRIKALSSEVLTAERLLSQGADTEDSFIQGCPLKFQVWLSADDEDAPFDFDDVASLTLRICDSPVSVTAPLMMKTVLIGAINEECTLEEFEEDADELARHASFDFTAAEANVTTRRQATRLLYWTLRAVEEVTAVEIEAARGYIIVRDNGSLGTAPDPVADYFTKEQTLALLAAIGPGGLGLEIVDGNLLITDSSDGDAPYWIALNSGTP